MSSKKSVVAITITTVVLTVSSIGLSNAASKTKVVSTKITRTSTNGITNPMAKDADHAERHAAKNAERAVTEALISKTIGVDSATIRTRLAAGESLGLIAGAKRADLITVLVTEHSKHIDAGVTAGKLTAEQATTLKAGLTAHVTAEVDRVGGKGHGGKGHGDKGHGDKGHGGMNKAPKTPAPATSPATTS